MCIRARCFTLCLCTFKGSFCAGRTHGWLDFKMKSRGERQSQRGWSSVTYCKVKRPFQVGQAEKVTPSVPGEPAIRSCEGEGPCFIFYHSYPSNPPAPPNDCFRRLLLMNPDMRRLTKSKIAESCAGHLSTWSPAVPFTPQAQAGVSYGVRFTPLGHPPPTRWWKVLHLTESALQPRLKCQGSSGT